MSLPVRPDGARSASSLSSLSLGVGALMNGGELPYLIARPVLGHVIEVREDLVELFLGDRVVFVVVAAGAAEVRPSQTVDVVSTRSTDVFDRDTLRG